MNSELGKFQNQGQGVAASVVSQPEALLL
ncbi:NADH dehydrogenase (ubiquinone) flavoprotein 2, isoform CRA_c [Rattus norvegicus]|uniref:NADH dehydrogenase (Ubiquinone) flavoprotein 2, isoform CRA_c n=1 Tax=Rattus norvegicus TaxID=10116 RepID=A6JRE3_RAT|nr:NADH dehydrogenase (ubiquinone) flavoprotein 2, isoform CRA_c [Rattus norvegicus]